MYKKKRQRQGRNKVIRMRVWIRERESASKGILSFKLGLRRERESNFGEDP